MTYQDLLDELSRMKPSQLKATVMVEVESYYSSLTEIHKAELRICDEDHSFFKKGKPVIFIETSK